MPSSALTVIHKYIRREMFDLTQQLFRAGPHNVAAIRRALDEIAGVLRGHAEHEDPRLAPILRKLDASLAERIAEDHRRLDDELERLRRAARALDVNASCEETLLAFQMDWNRFVSAYLAHLDDEERTLFPRLGGALPPVAAIVDSANAQGEQGRAFLQRLWAVTTCAERAAIERAEQHLRPREVA